jgi:hypothetical protein
MINIQTENILSLAGAAKAIPKIDGRHPNTSTVYRWISDGVRGVKLDSVRFGRRLCTSQEALQRFVVELSDAPTPKNRPRATTGTRTAKQRERDVAKAHDRLAARGLIGEGTS